MDDWDKFKQELLEDPATRAAYDARKPAYDIASKLIELRAKTGMTQRQVAAGARMTQPEIARLESGQVQPTWETLCRVLAALGAEVEVRLTQKGRRVRKVSLMSISENSHTRSQ